MAKPRVRLLPLLASVALGALLLKAAAIAESAGELTAGESEEAATTSSYAETAPPDLNASDPEAVDLDISCPAPDLIAEQAGLSQYEIQVLRSLADRRLELDDREASLDTRSLTIAAAESRLNDQIAELEKLEANIDSLLGQLDEKNEAQILSLVKWYESMKPKDAARIFDTLDDQLMLSLADRMKPAAMASVLAKMSSDRARTLTQLMAQKTEPPETVEELQARSGNG